jgi:DNA polymerase-1
MPTPAPIIFVDGSSYLYRAYHAMPPFVNSKGQHTNTIYGVINMLKSLLDRYKPDHVAIIFDAKGKSFRSDWYPEYKAHRPPMPEDLREQIEPLHKIIAAMGLPLLCVSGVEADDVIGTLARQATEQKLEVVISTGDKDIAQLVNEHITLINTMTNQKIDRAGVIAKFGLPPEQIIDYLALVGDTSDGVPGIPKVGPKTAVKWLEIYGSVEQIILHANEITGKVGENLRANITQLELAKKLVTIVTDLTLPFGVNELERKPADHDALLALFTELEFTAWSGALKAKSTLVKSHKKYHTIFNASQLSEWAERLKTADIIAFDTETTSLDYMQAKLVGFSFAITTNEACYVPLVHDYENAPQQLSFEEAFAIIQPILENEKIKKVGQNLKYDYEVLKNAGITLRGIAADSMLESYVYNSTATRHDMDSLALKYLQHQTITYENVAGKGAKQVTFNQVSIEQAAPYAAEDAAIALELHHYFSSRLEEKPAQVLNEIEVPLITVLAEMELNGVGVDKIQLQQQSIELGDRLKQLEAEIYQLAGAIFNVNSPLQLQEILYDKLALPILKKTPKGQPSTAEEVLSELALDYPLPKCILEYRQLNKLKSTYTDQLPKQIDAVTGRVHSSFHQAVTATGRLSSSNPNLQNIPVRTEEGRKIRKAFVARPGYKIIAADYSQIELRIMAHLSNDPGFQHAFQNNLDIHKATASEIFNVALDAVTPLQRRSAKAINFGLIYGMSNFGLAKQLGLDRNAAQNYIQRYFERYPGVKRYMDETRALAHQQGYVETFFGRRLYLPLINAENKMQQQAAERMAINAPMQGTAADIIKLAMIRVHEWLCTHEPKTTMIMQVHDELVFETPEENVQAIAEKLKPIMENAATLSVPLIVDVGIGDNWDEAH